MKIISITKLDDNSWRKYFKMSYDIAEKYYPPEYGIAGDWKDFKKLRINDWENLQIENFEEFVLIKDNNHVGFVDCSVYGKIAGFGFDALFDEIPDYILKFSLNTVYDYMKRQQVSEALHWSYNERRTKALKKINAPVLEDLLLSRLDRNEMNPVFYREIVNNFNLSNTYTTNYFEEIPENLLSQFIKVLNDIAEDINDMNPNGEKIPPITPDEWIKHSDAHRSSGTRMRIIIMTDESLIVGLCSIYSDTFRKDVLRHNGGLTAVTKKYRGLGIGKFLKAKMYLKLLEEKKHFKIITTDTMPWNKHMYKINKELGFKPYRTGCTFKISKAFLENYLNIC